MQCNPVRMLGTLGDLLQEAPSDQRSGKIGFSGESCGRQRREEERVVVGSCGRNSRKQSPAELPRAVVPSPTSSVTESSYGLGDGCLLTTLRD